MTPGDKAYLGHQRITVLADAGHRIYYVPGWHDYRVCQAADIRDEPKGVLDEDVLLA